MAWRDDIAAAPTSPLLYTLDAARAQVDSDTSEDEYTLARMIASEDFSGSPTTLACLGDAEVNRAEDKGQSVTAHATGGQGYGSQGGARPVSTARPPAPRHLLTARLLLRGFWFIGAPARGVSHGARLFFSPSAQLSLMQSHGIESYCPPDVILKRWTYSLPWGSTRCSLGSTRGSGQMEWVGPIDGVDPWRQMFLRPRTSQQDFLYSEALKVIESRGSYKGSAPPIVDPVLLVVVLGLAGASYLAGGLA